MNNLLLKIIFEKSPYRYKGVLSLLNNAYLRFLHFNMVRIIHCLLPAKFRLLFHCYYNLINYLYNYYLFDSTHNRRISLKSQTISLNCCCWCTRRSIGRLESANIIVSLNVSLNTIPLDLRIWFRIMNYYSSVGFHPFNNKLQFEDEVRVIDSAVLIKICR